MINAGKIITKTIQYESFDVMWTEMVKFAQEHPHHIFLCADDVKTRMIGFIAIWNPPKPKYYSFELDIDSSDELGVDSSEMNFERCFNIESKKYIDTYIDGRFPNELSDLFIIRSDNGKPYQTQTQRIEIAQRIVKAANIKTQS